MLRTTRSALLICTLDILRSDSTWVALAFIFLLIHLLVDVSPVRNRCNFQDDLWLCYICPLALFWRPSVISAYCAGLVPLVYSQSKNLMLICWPTILAICCWDTSTFAFKNPRFRLRPSRFKKKMNIEASVIDRPILSLTILKNMKLFSWVDQMWIQRKKRQQKVVKGLCWNLNVIAVKLWFLD